MGQVTEIGWTDSTWTPIRSRRKDTGKVGVHCERVSPGCKNCYSATFNKRKLPNHGTGLDFTVPNRDQIEIFLDEEFLVQPLHWKKPRKIFVCSQTDLFAEFVSFEFIDRIFAVMALCPQHTFQILTKRADRMREYITAEFRSNKVFAAMQQLTPNAGVWSWPTWQEATASVWLGVSVEDQANKKRIDVLREIPAAVRFVSLEPLLEDIGVLDLRGISQIIIGGESGHSARPFDIAWARAVVSQCKNAGVACFVKQLGSNPMMTEIEWRDRIDIGPTPLLNARNRNSVPKDFVPLKLNSSHGSDPSEWSDDLRVQEWPR